jgi:drug/metabolite transporter (DMT)-like permease
MAPRVGLARQQLVDEAGAEPAAVSVGDTFPVPRPVVASFWRMYFEPPVLLITGGGARGRLLGAPTRMNLRFFKGKLWTRYSGVALAVISATLFGASTPLAKSFLGEISPWMMAGVLYLGSGVGLLLVRQLLRWAQVARSEAPLRLNDLPWLAPLMLSGGIAGPLLLMIGLAITPASNASLLLNLEAVFTLVIAWTVFRENVDIRVGLGAVSIVAGALMLSWGADAQGLSWGALAIGGACLAWALDNNLTRKLSAADPVQLAMIKGLGAGLVNVGLAVVSGQPWPPLVPLAQVAALGFVGYGVSLTCFVLALRHWEQRVPAPISRWHPSSEPASQ